jgi:hypothetical protein
MSFFMIEELTCSLSKGCAGRALINRQIGVVSGDLYWASVCTGGERS